MFVLKLLFVSVSCMMRFVFLLSLSGVRILCAVEGGVHDVGVHVL